MGIEYVNDQKYYDILTPQEVLIKEFSKYLGLKEIPGEEDNPIIVDMFHQIGHTWVKDDETAWCACLMNFIALKTNVCRTGKLNAVSFLNIGKEKKFPQPGDYVIFWRVSPTSGYGHVGLFYGYNKSGNIWVGGGNQSNEVSIKLYNSDNLLGFRTPIFVKP